MLSSIFGLKLEFYLPVYGKFTVKYGSNTPQKQAAFFLFLVLIWTYALYRVIS